MEKVERLDQAIDVLIQAVNHGREKGVYGWKDLSLIGQSLELLETLSKQAAEQQEQAAPEIVDEKETSDVILDTKEG